MAKALKFAALAVGAVALIATGVGAVALGGLAGSLTVAGVSTGTLFLASGGLTLAASLLQKGPKVTASQTDRLTASIDPRAFRKTVLGQTAMPVDVRYEEWSGKDQEICDWIVAFASHAIDGLEEIWFDTEMAWSATTGVVAKYNGYFSIPNLVLEGTPQNAFTFGQWNRNSARLTGCAYARFRFKVTGNSKKAESPFSSGIPSRITVIGRGAKLYDPRRDSTVPGGSGPMRADDQSTWRFKTDDGVVIGENLPLQILRVILGWRIRNPTSGEMKLATGAGVPGRRISFPSFQVAANLADELVNRSAGGNEPRYHGAGVISEGDDHKTVLDMLCTACCGRFRDTGGKLSLAISHNDLAAAAVDDGLNDDDVVGAFTWDPDPSLETTPNVVRGRYVDATSASLYQLIDYPEVRLPSPDGQDRYLSLDLGVVESPSHAQRVAKQVLQRRQYSRQFAAPFDIRAWKYAVGDVLPFNFAPLGFKRGLFRVKEQELGQGGTCNMVLTFETPVFYLWDADDTLPVQGAEPIVYDRGNNPLILAIDEAATTAFWNGVTGDGKPADDATNSADPNSPFGPGTVGGAIKQISEFDLQIAAAKDQLGYISGTTIPGINTAITDANARTDAGRQAAADAVAAANVKISGVRSDLDKASSDLAAEVVRARGKDEDLAQRIDALSAGGGYDDTQLRALIQTVDTARADDKRAIANRVDSIVTDYQSRDTATNARVTQNITTFSNADQALGSRIDSVITDYRSLDSNTNARVTSNIASLADADRALGQRIDALVVEGGGYDDSYVRADITTNNLASIGRDNALGQRVDIVSASFSRGGGNLLGNTDLTTLDGWYMGSTLPGGSPLSLNQAGTNWMVGGIENNISVYQAGRADGGDGALIQIYSDAFGVTPGGYLQFYVFGASHRALAWASLYFYDDSGTQVGTAGENYGTRTGNGGHNAANWDQVGVKSLRVPDAARTARMVLRKYNTLSGEANSYAWWWHPYVGEARQDQTVWNAYASGNAKAVQVRSDAQIQQAQTAAVTAQQAVADLTTSVNARFSGVSQTLSSYDARITAAASDTQAYAGRTGTLEAQMSRSLPSELNSFTVAVNDRLTSINTAVNARIKSNEDVIADLPNRYAAATRTLALEAQVNGEDGSRLLARANDQASAIADQKVGAVTQSLQTLRSDLNGTYAQVQQQAGTLAGVDGRTSVYWSITGDTGDGTTKVQLSKANGSAGLFYVEANMLLAGNLVVDGTITARKFDRNSMSREGTSVWQGSITPSAGQTITVPWGLALSQIPALGRFIYEFTAAVVTNAGQTVVGTMNGKPSYLTYVTDTGGLTISARDNQGNVYVPRANASSAVLATTDFVPSWTATIRVGSYDTGWINNGDSYERQVAASYTVSRIDLKVTWVAI